MGDVGIAGVEVSSSPRGTGGDDVCQAGFAELAGDDRQVAAPAALQSLEGVLAPKPDASQFSILDRISPEELRVIVARATPGRPIIDDVYRIGVKRWFVIYTAPRCENKVQETARQIGFETYFPQGSDWKKQTRREMQQRKRREEIKRPVMTRYLFIQLPVDPRGGAPFGLVRNFSGVGGFVGTSDGPLVLSNDLVIKIRDREAAGEFDATKQMNGSVVPKWVDRGVRLLVDDGPFAGFVGLIEAILPNEILKVGVNLMGGLVPVELELAQVKQIS